MRARPVAWLDGDDARIAGAVVVGRARVELDNGGLYHALVLEPIGGETCATYWDRSSERFVTVELER